MSALTLEQLRQAVRTVKAHSMSAEEFAEHLNAKLAATLFRLEAQWALTGHHDHAFVDLYCCAICGTAMIAVHAKSWKRDRRKARMARKHRRGWA